MVEKATSSRFPNSIYSVGSTLEEIPQSSFGESPNDVVHLDWESAKTKMRPIPHPPFQIYADLCTVDSVATGHVSDLKAVGLCSTWSIRVPSMLPSYGESV
ncbi:hypothetical protein LAZ67_11000711 [Cordylochernes scorpioides]|uniref:Uncharacterized protein n=1 Tax=Cordylochernes scorpioides TaxID=51811 RepID=A0ABY6KYF7_9ARAC|nr:hypothetical protein LAZ67_11000711 [Cordylochernes scorpioides]